MNHISNLKVSILILKKVNGQQPTTIFIVVFPMKIFSLQSVTRKKKKNCSYGIDINNDLW